MAEETRNNTALIQAQLHQLGVRFFEARWYAEAVYFYQKALALQQDEAPREHTSVMMLDLANAYQMMGQYDAATKIYNHYLKHPDVENRSEFAQAELVKLQKRQWVWSIPPDMPRLTADDQRLGEIAGPMLKSFPALFRPVIIIWVDDSEQSLRRVHEIQRTHGGRDQVYLETLRGCEAVGAMAGYLHWVAVKAEWRKAKDSALRGLLAHELAHREVDDTFRGHFINPNVSNITRICNERLTDLLVIAKGYGSDLLESRVFQERIRGSLDKISALTTPRELRRILEERGSRPNQS